jgi:hypothetical protein
MMITAKEKESAKPPLIGSVRRFGEKGVLYEIVRPIDDATMTIRVLDTGEETSYPIADILRDPSE